MTVKDFLDVLMEQEQDIPVAILKSIMKQGSSWTGAYCGGEETFAIDNIKLVKGDPLGGLNNIDKVDHLEIVSNSLLEDDC